VTAPEPDSLEAIAKEARAIASQTVAWVTGTYAEQADNAHRVRQRCLALAARLESLRGAKARCDCGPQPDGEYDVIHVCRHCGGSAP
jgi:hypothetical protein